MPLADRQLKQTNPLEIIVKTVRLGIQRDARGARDLLRQPFQTGRIVNIVKSEIAHGMQSTIVRFIKQWGTQTLGVPADGILCRR